jgi:hypothetical protein
MNNVLVIITDDAVYATYVETICFKKHFTNEGERDEAITTAQSLAFSYAVGFGWVYVNQVNLKGSLTDKDIFEFLRNY